MPETCDCDIFLGIRYFTLFLQPVLLSPEAAGWVKPCLGSAVERCALILQEQVTCDSFTSV